MLPTLPQLSIALGGIEAATLGASGAASNGGALVREKIAWVGKQGVRAVQIDATAAGVRPRELDRSARRDFAAVLRRNELACSGLDVFIPPEHFVDAGQVDRAIGGVLGAIDLASELGTLSSGAVVSRFAPGAAVVSVLLPKETRADVRATIGDRAVERGVIVADFGPRQSEGMPSGFGVGVDPATMFAAGEDPVKLASALGERIGAARLSDLGKGIGAARVAPGAPGGRLDVLAYLVALATGAAGTVRFATLDLRGVKGQAAAVKMAMGAASVGV